MSTTKEIPRAEWSAFFDSFSRRHEGWRVTVEVIGADIGAQEEARELALEGITAELKNGESTIEIMIGREPEDHITHTITAPTHVRVKQTATGADEALEIEAEGGVRTLVRFRSAMLPEMVDAIV
jgi:hypothetical protein